MINSRDNNLLNELRNFTGTNRWYKLSDRNMVFTDGVNFLAKRTECYWLIDIIARTIPRLVEKTPRTMYCIHISATSDSCNGFISFKDVHNNELLSCDFPVNDFSVKIPVIILLLSIDEDDLNCLTLPREYSESVGPSQIEEYRMH